MGKINFCNRQSVSIHLRRGRKQDCPKVLVIFVNNFKYISLECEGLSGLNFFCIICQHLDCKIVAAPGVKKSAVPGAK